MQYAVHDRKIFAARLARAAACAAILAILPGCGAGDGTGPDGPATGMTKSYERGPLLMAVATSADAITTAETLTLTLSATLPDGYAVTFPEFPEPTAPEAGDTDDAAPAPSSFVLANYKDTAPELQPGGRVTRRRIYELEPFLAGEYTVPPLPVTFWEEVEGEDEKNTFETEAFGVTVGSVLPPGAEPDLKAIAGPMDMREPAPWGRYAAIGLLLAALAGSAYWYFFRYTPPAAPAPPPVPPHERALAALAEIRRAKLVEQGLYKEYYTRVSDVLRHYMEDQFHVRAPERTTEEFLEDLQHSAVLGLQEQLLLREFLRHCDLVKFARAEPTPEQIRETLETCERFIIDSEAACRAARTPSGAAAIGGEV